jgi:hypothetical protein
LADTLHWANVWTNEKIKINLMFVVQGNEGTGCLSILGQSRALKREPDSSPLPGVSLAFFPDPDPEFIDF